MTSHGKREFTKEYSGILHCCFWLILLLISVQGFTTIAEAQTATVKASPTPAPRPVELVKLLADASTAPPEIGVDTMLRVAQSKKVTDQTWRRQILENAFRMADDVKYPVRRKVVPLRGISVDTHAGYASYAFEQRFDGLSLKSRILRLLLPEEKERAKQIVFEIGGKLGLKPVACSEALVYEPDEIYQSVGAVAKAVFTDEEILEGSRALFLMPWFENITSPSQIAPALNLLLELRGPQAENRLLFDALATAMNKNFNDDRSFTYVAERNQITEKLVQLTSGVGREHLTPTLFAAYKGFLIKNLTGTRCNDSQLVEARKEPAFILKANYIFAEKPIKSEDIMHSELKGNAESQPYWKSQNALRILKEFRALNAIPKLNEKDGTPNLEWESKVSVFLESLNGWKPSDNEPEADVFNQKSVLFRRLISVIAAGRLKKSVFQDYMRYLSDSPMQKLNFIEWHFQAKSLGADDPQLFMEIAARSTNPTFSLMHDVRKLAL